MDNCTKLTAFLRPDQFNKFLHDAPNDVYLGIKKTAILLILVTSVSCQSGSSFEEYVNYVSEYINLTQHYHLPTDNAAMYLSDDQNATVNDYGSFDFIVIGAGDAGTVLARRLTEVEHFNVLLLEAGGMDDNFTDIPAMGVFTPISPLNWGYKVAPQENACRGMLNHQCMFPRGKVLGGSHLLSGMIYARGNRDDYDTWAKLGNKGWSYDEILPYFRKTEHDDTRDPRHTAEYHGFDGLLHINYTHPHTLNYEQVMKGCSELGLEETDVNGANQVGIQQMAWTIKNNVRQTGGNAFIKPIMNRKNLNVSLNSFVTELIVEDDTVTGVKFIRDNKLYVVTAKKEVLLSAGSINSPQILMLSGIGPAEELNEHNIEVKNNLPVGKYLSDHPCFTGLYIRTNQTYPNRTLAENLERYLEGKIPFTSMFSGQHIAFLNTKVPGQNPPNIEFITVNPPMSIPSQQFFNFDEETEKWISTFDPLVDFAVYVILLKPNSRGSVRIRSKNPVDFPIIDPKYFTDSSDEDIESMFEGIQFVVNLAKTEAMRSIDAKVITNSPRCEHLLAVSETEYWYCAIKQHTNTIFHPTSTTRMGISPKNSVVDSEFRVHNMKRLRVCDAGSMPEIVAGHPIAAILMMAEKLSDILKLEYSN